MKWSIEVFQLIFSCFLGKTTETAERDKMLFGALNYMYRKRLFLQ